MRYLIDDSFALYESSRGIYESCWSVSDSLRSVYESLRSTYDDCLSVSDDLRGLYESLRECYASLAVATQNQAPS